MSARSSGGAILLACGIAAIAMTGARATPSIAPPASARASPCAPHAAEAAARSRLSEAVVLRVMHVESRGRATAISPKGAMGCMQIMPATWRYLTARHGLGADPWNARFNMIGGALYLAELARQFGFPGAYAAYNAGPARYARHVQKAVPLPAETVAYMASVTGAPPRGVRGRVRDAGAAAMPPRWQDAGLFLVAEREARREPQRKPAGAPAKVANDAAAIGGEEGAARSRKASGEIESPALSDARVLFPLARPVRDAALDADSAKN